jgi:4-diphosphocytidyl-2-C-methyl-D-erythritol kinase
VEPVELPPFSAVVLADERGLLTADVYAELDRLEAAREPLDPEPLDPEPLRRLAATATSVKDLAVALDNDLQTAALSLRPELGERLELLLAEGALGAAVSGSGPTCFGLFEDRPAAERASAAIPGALVADSR